MMVSFKCVFRVVCVLCSVCATFWPIHLFNLDEDILDIKFKHLHSTKDTPYPSIKLCIDRTIFHKRQKPSRNMLDTTNRLKDDVNSDVLHIEDYIKSIITIHSNKTRPRFTSSGINITRFSELQNKGTFRYVVLQRFNTSDCLYIAAPFIENKGIYSINVAIRKDVFKKNTIPTRNEITSGTSRLTIGMFFNGNSYHLPSQNSGDVLLSNNQKSTCSDVVFNVKGMEILERRNKPSLPCIDYGNNGLFTLLNRGSKSLGCIPIGWEIPNRLPPCSQNETTRTLNQLLSSLRYFSAFPCRSIQNLQLEYNLDDAMTSCKNDNETLQITAVFEKFLFKEIKVVRAYTVYSLISSIGVICGVFFGVSLIDFPDMVKGLRRRVRKHLSKMPIKRRKSQKLIHETLDTMKDEGRELNKELQNAKKEISFIKREYGTVVEELQNVKNDIFLMKIIENHMIKCLEKQEYESLV